MEVDVSTLAALTAFGQQLAGLVNDIPFNGDAAAIGSRIVTTHVNRSGVLHQTTAAFGLSDKGDNTVLLSYGKGFDNARVVHQAIINLIGQLGLHLHQPTISLNGSAVGNGVLNPFDPLLQGLIHGDINQNIVRHRHGDLIPHGQVDLGLRRVDGTGIADRSPAQHGESILLNVDHAFVRHRSRAVVGVLKEHHVAIQEVVVGNIQGRGKQGADVHTRGRPKQNPAGVYQVDLAIGVDVSKDSGRILADDPV